MKKTLFLSALAIASLLTACSSSDDEQSGNAPVAKKGIVVKATCGQTGDSNGAKRVSYVDNETSSTIVPSWETTDKLMMYWGGGQAELTCASIDGNAATFTNSTATPPADGAAVTAYIEHANVTITSSGATAAYTSQDGTLAGAAIIYKGTSNYTTANGAIFAFAAQNALLKITASDLTAGEAATLTYKCNDAEAAKVTFTPSSATQTIYMAVPTVSTTPTSQSLEYKAGNADAVSQSLTPITLAAGVSKAISKSFASAPSVPEGALTGDFTINSSGDKVKFAKGNLQATYDGSTWTWGLAEHQWDYIGNAAANTSVNGAGTVSATGTVDLFGFVGASSGITGDPAIYGIHNSTSNADYGATLSETLKSDWGTKIGAGWRTLTKDEWVYVFNTRTTSSGIRYAKGTVNGVSGVILLPDNWSTSYHALASTNTANAAFTTNTISASEWTNDFESHGAVFLPAAGCRFGSTVNTAGTSGYYWSSTAHESDSDYACYVYFDSGNLFPSDYYNRRDGQSVRLVRPAE